MAELRIGDRRLNAKTTYTVAVSSRTLTDGRVAVDRIANGVRVAYDVMSRAEWDALTLPAVEPAPVPSPVPATDRPYGSTSPFNVAIPASPTIDPQSAQLVASALAYGPPGKLAAGIAPQYDWGHPVYYAKASDPLYTLHATEPWGANPLEGIKIPIPAGALPAGGSDHHMTVVTPDGWEYDLWLADMPSGGTLSFGWGGRLRIDGDGLTHGPGATAAQFGSLAGVIRPEELAAGRIDHALFIVLKNTAPSYVWPAEHTDGKTLGGVPMGTRFQLTLSDAQITALSVPAWKKAILTALAHYGGFVGDSGGGGFGFQLLSAHGYTSFGKPDPFVEYAKSIGMTPDSSGVVVFDVASGVDWAKYLRVLTPPTP